MVRPKLDGRAVPAQPLAHDFEAHFGGEQRLVEATSFVGVTGARTVVAELARVETRRPTRARKSRECAPGELTAREVAFEWNRLGRLVTGANHQALLGDIERQLERLRLAAGRQRPGAQPLRCHL